MRGLLSAFSPRPTRCRIIPARAGFTRLHPRRPRGGWDHPRTRGVYRVHPLWAAGSRGSSPHTRGLPGGLPPGGQRRRIIPAHAGFTAGTCPCRRGVPDHPRTRGVYVTTPHCSPRRSGSSPHTRGLPGGGDVASAYPGIIPAHAGFTAPWTPPPSRGRIIPAHAGFTVVYMVLLGVGGDHPRTRGVYRPLRE